MSGARLRVTYLLEDTALFGGVKIVLQQANLLAARGHRVTVASRGGRPRWFPVRADFVTVRAMEPDELPPADVTIATFWTTIAAAAAVCSGQGVHYCQGFEAAFRHNVADHPRILEVYSLPLPAFALAPHLADLVRRRFGRPTRMVPPPLSPYWRAGWRWRPHRVPRILVVHPFEIEWKGVATALAAVKRLRDEGLACRLIRLSQWPLGDAERALLEPDEFHSNVPPEGVAHLLRSCDVLLAPSWEEEGFGLPVLEAMASGLPVVASDISAFRSFARNGAVLVPFDSPEAFAVATRELLLDRGLWQRRRRAGRTAATPFAEERVAEVAEQALYWAADGAWKADA